jgi:hypothetical protein
MAKRDPRIDAYIRSAQPFARPILKRLRAIVHEGCPECHETLKWSMPSFLYKGILCGMAAFKQHATFGFWKHQAVVGPKPGRGMGSFGCLTSVKDLPPKRTLLTLIRKAKQLNDEGVGSPIAARKKRPPLPVPHYFRLALHKNAKARAAFEAFPPSHRRAYLEWIIEARRPETREKRIATTLAWLAQGKARNWKYARKIANR